MSRLVNIVGAVARHEVARSPVCELAVVTSNFDDADGPDSYTVSVEFKDTGLALPRVPVMCGITGAAALPRQGDLVLVLLPRGDLSSAVVLGPVYSDQRRPPAHTRDEVVLVWPGDADDPEAGAVDIRAMADGSDRAFTVALGGDKNATLSITDGAIELTAGGATAKISHSSASDGAVELAAGGTRLELKQDGDLTIESATKLVLKAPEIAIEGQATVKINGQIVEIN
jgi:phage baseplate assembly protein gpV